MADKSMVNKRDGERGRSFEWRRRIFSAHLGEFLAKGASGEISRGSIFAGRVKDIRRRDSGSWQCEPTAEEGVLRCVDGNQGYRRYGQVACVTGV
jgi:hypothetical protein